MVPPGLVSWSRAPRPNRPRTRPSPATRLTLRRARRAAETKSAPPARFLKSTDLRPGRRVAWRVDPSAQHCGRIDLETPAQVGGDREADRCCGSRVQSLLWPARTFGAHRVSVPPPRPLAGSRAPPAAPPACIRVPAVHGGPAAPPAHAGPTSIPFLPFHARFRAPLPHARLLAPHFLSLTWQCMAQMAEGRARKSSRTSAVAEVLSAMPFKVGDIVTVQYGTGPLRGTIIEVNVVAETINISFEGYAEDDNEVPFDDPDVKLLVSEAPPLPRTSGTLQSLPSDLLALIVNILCPAAAVNISCDRAGAGGGEDHLLALLAFQQRARITAEDWGSFSDSLEDSVAALLHTQYPSSMGFDVARWVDQIGDSAVGDSVEAKKESIQSFAKTTLETVLAPGNLRTLQLSDLCSAGALSMSCRSLRTAVGTVVMEADLLSQLVSVALKWALGCSSIGKSEAAIAKRYARPDFMRPSGLSLHEVQPLLVKLALGMWQTAPVAMEGLRQALAATCDSLQAGGDASGFYRSLNRAKPLPVSKRGEFITTFLNDSSELLEVAASSVNHLEFLLKDISLKPFRSMLNRIQNSTAESDPNARENAVVVFLLRTALHMRHLDQGKECRPPVRKFSAPTTAEDFQFIRKQCSDSFSFAIK